MDEQLSMVEVHVDVQVHYRVPTIHNNPTKTVFEYPIKCVSLATNKKLKILHLKNCSVTSTVDLSQVMLIWSVSQLKEIGQFLHNKIQSN